MNGLTLIVGGRLPRIPDEEKGAEYREFNPPRKPEEYLGVPGPHDGLALTYDVIQAISQARVLGKPHQYLVRGEWVRKHDGVRFLDFAVDRAWVTANSHYQLIDGYLRWVCPGCGRLSGAHNKGCDYR